MSTTTRSTASDSADRPDWLRSEHWPYQVHQIEVEGRGVAYTDVGSGPTIVLVHVGMWSVVRRDVSGDLVDSFRVVTFDAPASGLSEGWQGIDIVAAADALDAIVLHLRLEGFVLALHDLGGPVGLEAGFRRPDRIAGLVALNSFGWRPRGAAFRSMPAIMGCAPVRELDALTGSLPAASSTRLGVGRRWERPMRRTFRHGMSRRGTRAFHRYMESARRHDYTRIEHAAVALTDVPTLTIFGQRNDPMHFQCR